ncbi:MAG: hypothetical protein HYT40_02600 [Candidatus Sungbacteria bacterium]|uniref:Uncharacterized protein n=1 Tax=Candidatus Sungiibacteriota bacterium TaxID=2750080 RepID=A0A931WP66_9BACT|nr:hypothetical protein [Candidatus Sungbacteria bacterium]
MDWRTRKQLTILLIVFGVVFGALFWIGYSILHSPGSCTDNKKNQGEEEADCGGPCAPCAFKHQRPVEVFFARFIPVRPTNYDIVAQVQNPNDHLAATPLVYRVRLYDDKNAEVGRRDNVTFLDPNDRIYVIESNFVTERTVVRAVAEILPGETKWQFTNELRPDLTVGKKNYDVVMIDDREQSRVTAELVNRAAFTFRQVNVRVALLDESRNIIGVAKTIIANVRPGEPRPIEITWPGKFEGSVARIDMEARTNWLDSSNILSP